MSYEIKAEIKILRRIICDEDFFYKIPDYQRPYSWDGEHVSALIDDLINAFSTSKEESYFCGSLVIIGDGQSERYDVIDGQQRLTTFIILSCVLRDFFQDKYEERAKDWITTSIQDKYQKDKDKQKPRLLTSTDNQNMFLNTVINGIDKSKDKDKDKNRYFTNALIMKDLLDRNIQDKDEFNSFVEWIFTKVVLTKIICPNQEAAIQIFNVLNDRGMQLTSVDIVKSTLMQKINEEDRKVFISNWTKINTKLEEYDLSFQNLLQTYFYFSNHSNQKSSLHKELLNSFNEMGDSLQIIHELGEFAKSYIKVLTSEDKYIYGLNYLRHQVYWTSILTTAQFKDVHFYDKLKEILLSYYYQNWISGGTTTRIKQTSFSIIEEIKNENPKIEKIQSLIEDNLNKYNTKDSYKESLGSNDIYNKNWCKPLLFLLEYFSTDTSNQNFFEISNKELQVEHILPQEPKDGDWTDFSAEDRKTYTHCWGNLTLLSGRKNLQASNKPFEVKKETYKNRDKVATSFELTRKIFENTEWTKEVIDKREKDLIKKLNEILKL